MGTTVRRKIIKLFGEKPLPVKALFICELHSTFTTSGNSFIILWLEFCNYFLQVLRCLSVNTLPDLIHILYHTNKAVIKHFFFLTVVPILIVLCSYVYLTISVAVKLIWTFYAFKI